MSAPESLPRVLLVLSSANPLYPNGTKSGYYWSEAFHPHEVFEKAGYHIDAVSLTGVAIPDEGSVEPKADASPEAAAWHNKSHSIHRVLAALKNPEQVNPEDYSIVYFAGGASCSWDYPTASSLHAIAASIYERGGIVAAVCHGVSVLEGLKLSDGTPIVKGKKATGFSEGEEAAAGLSGWVRANKKLFMREAIERNGGTYISADIFTTHVVVDGRLATGQNPASAGPLAVEVIKLLKSQQSCQATSS